MKKKKEKKSIVINILRNLTIFWNPKSQFLETWCSADCSTSPNSVCIILDAVWSEVQKRICDGAGVGEETQYHVIAYWQGYARMAAGSSFDYL